MRRLVRPVLWVACLTPMTVMWIELALGRIRGEWIKEVTHRTGYWGLLLIVATLAITPLRRLAGWNWLQPYRRTLGLFAFFYVCVHFLIYVLLDRQLQFEFALAWRELVKDVAKRPYITVGFTGFLLMIPLAVTSTKGWIRRLGRKWVTLHALLYLTALAGVVHFMWGVKADVSRPTAIGLGIALLLALRLVPRQALARLRGVGAAGAEAKQKAPEPATAG